MSARTAAFFDLDGTLTKVRTWAGIINFFKERGEKRFTYYRFWSYHSILYLLHKAGLLSQTGFREPWAANLGWFFRGMTEQEAEAIWQWTVDDHFKGNWQENALKILEEHKQKGDFLVLVSASPAPLGRYVAGKLGMDMAVGTEFELKDGRFTGKVKEQVNIADRKAILTTQRLTEAGIEVDFAASSAYADAPGDLAMLEMVGRPVALNGDELLLPIAEERGWEHIP